MICEYCSEEINGKFGSGRFCNKQCASAFSTRDKRQEINKTVSKKLKGRRIHDGGFKKGYDPNRKKLNAEDIKRLVEFSKIKRNILYAALEWNDLPLREKRRRILNEQKLVCFKCGLNEWLGKPLVLELHHENGIKKNNSRENLSMLCPNCHSQTPTYRKNRKKKIFAERLKKKP